MNKKYHIACPVFFLFILLVGVTSCKSGKNKPKASVSYTIGGANGGKARVHYTLGKSKKINVSVSSGSSSGGASSKTNETTKTPTTKAPAESVDNTPVSAKAEKVVQVAKTYRGTKYKFGGTDKKGIDCSGLTCAAYKEVGIALPRVSKDQSKVGKRIYIGDLQKGDLVFFGATPGNKNITHVGIISYHVGDVIKFIHASTNSGVIESEFSPSYWRPRYIMATRPLN